MKEKQEIFKTDDFLGVFGVCQTCLETEGFGIITGRSGYGKSYSLKSYAKREKVIYIECNECMTVRDIIKEIEEAAGISHTYGSINDGLRNIKHYFNAHRGYLLIIDEADKLISKFTQKKLEVIRNIYDQSGLAVVLAGEPVLKNTIERFIPRSASRVDIIYELKGLSENEVICYLKQYRFSDEAIAEMIRRATNGRNGCFRLLNRTFKNVLRMCEDGQEIDLEAVEAASSMMLI